ncbi:MAG: penicillin-binding protein 2 [Pseudomonadales bacterium]|jgi:penicillin-binding protein 2
MASTLPLNDPSSERRSFSARAAALFAIAMVLIGVLVARLVQLQIVDYDTYRTRSDENRIQVQPLPPPRGLIYDRNGVLLAENRPVSSLALVTERVGDFDALLAELRTLVDIDEADLENYQKRLKRRRRPYEAVTLREALSEAEVAKLAVNRYRLPGVEVRTELKRHYPFGAVMAHAVGSVRRITEDDLRSFSEHTMSNYSATEFIGRRGVERFYERSLHGEVGYQRVEINAHGRILKVLDIQPPKSGRDITLQLDSRLQIAATAALGDRRGAVVALDPKTGGILALVSNPGYDPNLFVTGISNEQYQTMVTSLDTPLFNRAVNGQYAPGSTFKPVVALAGLSNGVVTWEEHIEDKGWFKLAHQDRIYRDWSWRPGNSGGQGTVNLYRAIYRSANVFFYDLATRLTIDQLGSFARQFGIGRQLAVDVSDASSGLMPDPIWKQGAKGEVWYPGDMVNLGIGQGDLLVTPLQLATMANVIANRGRVVRPRMLKLAADEQPPIEYDPPRPLPDVIGPSPDDWERIVDAMEAVVHRGNKGYGENGTAWYYIGRDDIPYRIAGKSGTAQVVEIKQGEAYDEEELDEYTRKHAWFIAFAPADDPQIALAVLVENGGGGSAVAGPVAREVLDYYLLPQMDLATAR